MPLQSLLGFLSGFTRQFFAEELQYLPHIVTIYVRQSLWMTLCFHWLPLILLALAESPFIYCE